MLKNSIAFRVVLILLVLAILCAIPLYLYLNRDVCRTNLCLHSAENLLSSRNEDVDPCNDFYEFACGNWPQQHPIPDYQVSTDWFDAQQDVLLKDVSNFLIQKNLPDEPKPVRQARTFYSSCMKQSKSTNNNFTVIGHILENVNLPKIPFSDSPSDEFNWLRTAVLSKGELDQDFFISFSISSDPKNRTLNKIHISKPSGLSPLPTHRYRERILRLKMKEHFEQSGDEETPIPEPPSIASNLSISEEYTNGFVQYLRNMSEYTVEFYKKDWSDYEDEFNKTVMDILALHVEVERYTDQYYVNDSLIPKYTNIDRLQNMTDMISKAFNISPVIIDWKSYFEDLFNKTNISLDWDSPTDSIILISDEEYFQHIFTLLSSTPPKIVKYYMWMMIVGTVAPYTNKAISKFKEDFVFNLLESKPKPRDLYCADVVNQMLGMATAYSVVNDTFMKRKMEKIEIMVNDIIDAFAENTKYIPWMDEDTKNVTVKKIRMMKKYIGFPKWLNDTTTLNEYYKNVAVNEDDFLGNILNKIQVNHLEMLELYKEFNDFDQDTWISNPMDVNAYNYMEGNAITIPAGILQFPFYGQGLEALNYGAIGSIIGHEITHSFDNTGKEYDDVGNKNPWWTDKTKTEFENRTHCIIDYYESFIVPGTEDTKVNGKKTLDENIADNGGLRSAFNAYKKYVNKYGKEQSLIHFEEYSTEQLFFLGFANSWCEHGSERSVQQAITDNHSPNKVRVIGSLSNSEEFVQAWQCKRGSAMNPSRDKCKMW